eukprot:scaffold18651_cov70-Phaeocystis_antarctica.AAC.3
MGRAGNVSLSLASYDCARAALGAVIGRGARIRKVDANYLRFHRRPAGSNPPNPHPSRSTSEGRVSGAPQALTLC